MIALTRPVSPRLASCELTHSQREPIDVERAARQHAAYEHTLRALGCHVVRLPAAPELPDSVFVEDTAVVLDEVAIIARPGAASRRPETAAVAEALAGYREPRLMTAPATLDGGDVLRIGRTLFVGRSSRTNAAGIAQLAELTAAYGYEVVPVEVRGCLHLKSAVTLVADDTVLLNPAWVEPSVFAALRVVDVDPAEPAAANALRLATRVVYDASHERTARRLQARGIRLARVDLSELAKAEGGVTCCSVVVGVPAGGQGGLNRVRP
ncbi:MAG: dimethylarginine dimethylaminohydrolase family protein [Longimicrobiales bacterium]